MFHTKICGIQRMEDVQACARAGADCIGLNFFPRSVRYVDPVAESTRRLNTSASGAGLVRVGLFVNESVDRIKEVAAALSLDAVQLHGDETPVEVAALAESGLDVIRAIRLPTLPISPGRLHDQLEPLWELPITFLLDADAGPQFGGGGKQLHWPSVAAWAEQHDQVWGQRWILAGGLDAECVAEAKQTALASRVDVASGVEAPKGRKSGKRIQEFVNASRLGGVDETS